MQDEIEITKQGAIETAEPMPTEVFTKPARDGEMISYIEREVEMQVLCFKRRVQAYR